jgi:hypothetical protein
VAGGEEPESVARLDYVGAVGVSVDDAGAAGQAASQRFDFTFGSIAVSVGGAAATDTWTAPTS